MYKVFKKLVFLFAIFIASLFVLSLFHQTVSAVNPSVMPDPSDFSGTSPRLEVSQQEVNNSLQAAHSVVKIVSASPNPTLIIHNYNHCSDQHGGTDTVGYAPTQYAIYSTDADGNSVSGFGDGATGIISDYRGCPDANTSNITLQGSTKVVVAKAIYYVWIFDASMIQEPGCGVTGSTCSDGGVNDFWLTVSSGYISYAGYNDGITDNDNTFALQNRVTPNNNDPTNYNIPFALKCSDNTGIKYLSWFDDDQTPNGGQSGIQSHDMTFVIKDVTTGALVGPQPEPNPAPPQDKPSSGYDYLGGGVYRPDAGADGLGVLYVNLKNSDKYEWDWSNVDNDNGIQFTLPDDSYYAYIACPTDAPPSPPKVTITCDSLTISAVDPNDAADPVSISYTINGNTYSGPSPFTHGIVEYDGISSQLISITATDNAGSTPASSSVPANCAKPTCTGATVTLNAPGESDGIPDPYTMLDGTATVIFGGGGKNGNYGIDGMGAPPNMTLSFGGSPFTPTTMSRKDVPPSAASDVTYKEVESFTGTAPSYGAYSTTWSVDGVSCTDATNGNPKPDVVEDKPYMKVYGGDTISGSAFSSDAGSCSPNKAQTAADTFDWGTTVSPYNGSSTSGSTFTRNLVDGFASGNTAQTSGSIQPAPKSISFANDGTPPSASPDYGGNYGSPPCVPDYYSDTWNASYLQTLTATAPTIINAMPGPPSLGAAQRNVIRSKSDVYISGNLTYSPWTSVQDMPLFYVVVKGANIYIDSSVDTISGVFIAEPIVKNKTITGGNIYTCATDSTGTPSDYQPSGMFSSTTNGGCSRQLTVNGAFIANDVHFSRTNDIGKSVAGGQYGDISNAKPLGTTITTDSTSNCTSANNQAAETFCYTPMQWLISPFASSSNELNSITGLAPTL